MHVRRLMILAVLAMLVADAMAVVPGARAGTVITFNTTAQFDSGTKTGISTATTACEAIPANRFLLTPSANYLGISLACSTGVSSVASSLQNLSYDMGTLTSGAMKDFSGNSLNGVIHGSTLAPGRFGNASSFNGVNQYIATPTGIDKANTASTVSFWLYVNTSSQAGSTDIFARGSGGGGNYTWIQLSGSSPPYHVAVQYQAGGTACYVNGSVSTCGAGTNIFPFFWYHVAVTGTVKANPDAFYIGAGNVAGVLTAPTKAVIDEFQFFARTLSTNEIGALANLQNQYTSSGNWLSSLQNTKNLVPQSLMLNYGNATTSAYISRLAVLTATGIVAWAKVVNLQSGVIAAIFIDAPVSYLSQNWSVEVDLIGGTASPFVSSVSVNMQALSAIQPTFDANAMIFIVFLFLLFGLGLGGFVLELPVLTVLGGIAGFVFGGWLFFSVGASNVPMAVVLWGVSSVFMLIGGVMAMQVGD